MSIQDLQASDWVAIFSGFIALLALATTFWQAHLTRAHNFLSSRPIIDIDSESIPERRIGIVLRNCGPGPAFIKKVTMTFKKTKYSLTASREFNKFAAALVSAGLPTSDMSLQVPFSNSVVASGSEFILILIDEPNNRAAVASRFRELAHECHLVIEYESLYGQKF